MLDSSGKIAIGSDHAGFDYKKLIIGYLVSQKFEVKDFGAFSAESMDYPDPIHPLAKAVNDHEFSMGIILCGSGNGVSMVANKYPLVRAALCWNIETARLARQHNDANILALPARFITSEQALDLVKVFLSEPFEGGRHQRRVEKISQLL